MSTTTHGGLFYGTLAAIAMIGPVSLVIAAASMPESPSTGQFVVYGHGIILAVVATALVLRVAYGWGYSHALKIVARQPKFSAIAQMSGIDEYNRTALPMKRRELLDRHTARAKLIDGGPVGMADG